MLIPATAEGWTGKAVDCNRKRRRGNFPLSVPSAHSYFLAFSLALFLLCHCKVIGAKTTLRVKGRGKRSLGAPLPNAWQQPIMNAFSMFKC